MGTPSLLRNLGHQIAVKNLADTIAQFDHGTYVANTSVSATGFMLDLLSPTGVGGVGAQPGTAFTKRPASGKIVIPVKVGYPSGSTAQTFTVRAWLKHATASGGTYVKPAAGPQTPSNTVVLGPATATGTKRYVCEFPVQLDLLNRYVKLHISHNGNSTASKATLDIGMATLVIGGADQTPASASGRG